MAITARYRGDRRMIKFLLFPVSKRSVAGIALRGGTGWDVIKRFSYIISAGCQIRTVMASHAGRASNYRMVHVGRLEAGVDCMAALTWRIGRDVVRKLGYRGHTEKNLPIVAACTINEDAGVAHHPRTRIISGGMASCARLCRGKVVCRQCNCLCRFESRRRGMTALARRAGQHVIRRLGHRCHTGKCLPIVAACTAAEDACMAEYRLLPFYRFVAIIT
jgi:hypothetical protein